MKKIVAPLKRIAVRAGIVLIAAGLVGVWLAPYAKWNRLIRPYYEEAVQIVNRVAEVHADGGDPIQVAADASVLANETIWNVGPVPACAYVGVLHLRTAMDIIERSFFDMGMVSYREMMLRLARGHLEAAREDVFCP